MRNVLALGFVSLGLLAGCGSKPEPVVSYQSEQAVSFKENYGLLETKRLTLQMREMAQKHCEKYGKNAQYVGYQLPTLREAIYEFTCNVSKVEVQE